MTDLQRALSAAIDSIVDPTAFGEPEGKGVIPVVRPLDQGFLRPSTSGLLQIGGRRQPAPRAESPAPRAERPAPRAESREPAFDLSAIRRDFPLLAHRSSGGSGASIWLDSAATTQKPSVVIERIDTFYRRENSNTHRAAHALAARATEAYEEAREEVRRFLNARIASEIVFTRGTTEAINLVAQSWGRRFIESGDEILVSGLEHHANIVPWQLLAAEKGARLCVIPIDDAGDLDLSAVDRLVGPRTKIVAVTHVSNAIGTVTPVAEIAARARRAGARVVVDGAQAVSHMPVDVRALDADFYVFSGHKVFGPTGIGALYAKRELLEQMPPWQGGGNMIADVRFEETVYQPAPARFEAGTGNIAGAIGLGAALRYVGQIGRDAIGRHEHGLIEHLTSKLRALPKVRVLGEPRQRAGVVSFVVDGCRCDDIGAMLDREGIAVRAGHHCAQPALRHFGVETSVRPSVALYNTLDEVDAFVDAIARLVSGLP